MPLNSNKYKRTVTIAQLQNNIRAIMFNTRNYIMSKLARSSSQYIKMSPHTIDSTRPVLG